MTSTIAAAALAGLMGSPHCVAMCGGFATACARPRRGLLAWHAGRLTTYATLGALAGATGAALPGPAWLPAAISIALLAWFAAALAGVAPQPSVRLPALARIGARLATRPGPAGRFLLGLTTGLLPCGMVYA
ncbi:MAG: sulfite exporter TauE/SafE family protein, partial [Gemmatimonadetes bacterium]|nr:sulfite exporter TauE/SafE family protein [Gemmatimonadota bacterium]